MSIISFAPDVRSLLAKRGAYSGTDCTMNKIQVGGHRDKTKIRGYALVDDEDYEQLNQYNWFAAGDGSGMVYAMRHVSVSEDIPYRDITMHRSILGKKKGLEVDHINRDGLDNRRENLRLCTRSQNSMNQGLRKNSLSGYRGVSYHQKRKRWIARIRVDGKHVRSASFKTAEEAARAYDEFAKKYHGEFASLNFTTI